MKATLSVFLMLVHSISWKAQKKFGIKILNKKHKMLKFAMIISEEK